MGIFDKSNNQLDLSRRSFLVGTVNTSLVMAFAPMALSSSVQAQSALSNRTFSPTVWFEIDTAGKVLVNIAKAEMGQHVGTALAKIVADELGASWDSVSIKHVDTDPKWGYMVTGGSWSVFTSYKPLSQAGAAGRIAMIEAGAKLMGKPFERCTVKNGFVHAGRKKLSFAEIVSKGDIDRTFTADELAALPIKSPKKHDIIGQEAKALDIPSKTNGSAVYGIDVEIPGMIYARPVVPPTRYGNKVKSVDDTAAKTVSGYIGYKELHDPSEHLHGWVSVLAQSYYAAVQAADKIKVEYELGPSVAVDEATILAEGRKLVNDNNAGVLLVNDGDVDIARKDSSKNLQATYTTSTAIHFQLEPVNATTEFKDGKWHIHTGNQWQSLTLPAVAKALEVPEDQVVLNQYYLGGGFGRRLFGDYAIPSALTAKAVGKPVKMVFTREDDSHFAQPRSASVSGFKGSIDKANQVTGIEHALSAGWPTSSMAPFFLAPGVNGEGKIDMFSASGSNHWYTLPSHKVRVINNKLANDTFLPGWLRSVGPGWINWGVESFMDEMAHASKQDPVEFRLTMLDGKGKQAGDAPQNKDGALRLKKVLERAKTKAKWGAKLPKNEGLGIALTFGQERNMPTWLAVVAHVSVKPSTGNIDVKKITAVVDCGKVVHPDGAMAQMEGSLLWGLSLALHEGNLLEKGQVSRTNLNTYTPLRMDSVPELDIEFIPSDDIPVGLGEPGVVAVAPAIGNAIYNAVGVRLRDLPMNQDLLKRALA